MQKKPRQSVDKLTVSITLMIFLILAVLVYLLSNYNNRCTDRCRSFGYQHGGRQAYTGGCTCFNDKPGPPVVVSEE
jgi:hypothetical protein